MKIIIKTNFVDKNQVTVVKIHKFRGKYTTADLNRFPDFE